LNKQYIKVGLMSNRYDTAQICLNGHIITDSIQVDPEDQKFCGECGASTITQCQSCDAPIRGREYIFDFLSGSRPIGLHRVAQFCYQCGEPYPWLKEKLDAAKELAQELDELSEEEKQLLTKSIDDLVKETPKTELAAIKFKKMLSKTGKETAEAFRSILIDIVSELAKKTLWPS
jgi:hypothetical protein